MDNFYKLNKMVSVTDLYHCFCPTYGPDFNFEGERHDFWECVYVLQGSVGVAEDNKVYELNKNDIVFHKPMEFHRIWASNKTSPSLIITSFKAEGVGMEFLSNGVFSLDEKCIKLMCEATEIATENIIKKEPEGEIYEQILSNRLESMMLYMLMNMNITGTENETYTASNYKAIVNVLSNNLDKPLQISDIAKMTGMSESNLKKCFRRYSGMGVIKYFNNMKIMKAQTLVRQGFSMQEVSDMLGYASQNYFSTAFKKEVGLSPLEYRKKISGGR